MHERNICHDVNPRLTDDDVTSCTPGRMKFFTANVKMVVWYWIFKTSYLYNIESCSIFSGVSKIQNFYRTIDVVHDLLCKTHFMILSFVDIDIYMYNIM